MKTITIFLILTASSAFAQRADTTQNGGVIDDVIIQDNYEAEFREEKVPVELALDFSDVVTFEERVNWDSIDRFYNQAVKPTFNAKINTLTSQLAQIRPAPVKTFKADFSNIQRWQLDITASDGTIFRSIAGVGNPPGEIAWDGLSDAGEPLAAGANYAYSFTAVDKAGNKRTFPGQTFAINAFYLYMDDGLMISIASNKLFSADGLYLQPQARDFASEAAMFIRMMATESKVQVYCGHSKVNDFLALVARELIAETEIFSVTQVGKKQTSSLNFMMR